MISRHTPLPRRTKPIAKKPAKRPKGYDDPEYRAWLRTWPCWVCLVLHCRKHLLDFKRVIELAGLRGVFGCAAGHNCGETHASHTGENATGLKCRDREAMPLGAGHHLHETAGGRWDSYHSLGRKKFFDHYKLNADEILAELHRLYRQETGRGV